MRSQQHGGVSGVVALQTNKQKHGINFWGPTWLGAHHLLSPAIKLGPRHPRKKEKRTAWRDICDMLKYADGIPTQSVYTTQVRHPVAYPSCNVYMLCLFS